MVRWYAVHPSHLLADTLQGHGIAGGCYCNRLRKLHHIVEVLHRALSAIISLPLKKRVLQRVQRDVDGFATALSHGVDDGGSTTLESNRGTRRVLSVSVLHVDLHVLDSLPH